MPNSRNYRTPTLDDDPNVPAFMDWMAQDVANDVAGIDGRLGTAETQLAGAISEATRTKADLAQADAELQAAQGNNADRLGSLETLAGLAPGDVSDATMASVAANPGSDFAAQLQAILATAKIFKGKNGQTFLRIDPTGENTQSILEMSPPGDGLRVKLDFWSAPVGTPGRQRTMSIESHGTNDPYNPTNNHNSIYTTDANGDFQHVFDWDWGPTYDALLHIPTLKLTAHQDALLEKNVGVGTRTPAPSNGDAQTRTIHMATQANRPAELRQLVHDSAGVLTAEGRAITYSTKMFVGTITAHDTVLVAGGEANANLTLKPDGRSGFAKDVGIGTTAPTPATAGRRVLHITDATGVETRLVSGAVSMRLAAVAAGAGTAQAGTDSAHDLTLYAGGIARGQLRLGGAGTLGFFNKTPVARPTSVAQTAEGIHAALIQLGLIA